jgi:orotate phosphoribosyltransferase
MNKAELAKKIYDVSHLTGTFTLRSGQISNEYFDKYLFESNPEILDGITEHMKLLIPKDTNILAGLEMGGIPIATMLSSKANLPVIFVRKTAKEYGTCKLAEGENFKGKKVCIIEDVVTTGGQIIESATKLRERGAEIDTVLSVILRDNKSIQNLKDHNLNLISLFKMNELKINED